MKITFHLSKIGKSEFQDDDTVGEDTVGDDIVDPPESVWLSVNPDEDPTEEAFSSLDVRLVT